VAERTNVYEVKYCVHCGERTSRHFCAEAARLALAQPTELWALYRFCALCGRIGWLIRSHDRKPDFLYCSHCCQRFTPEDIAQAARQAYVERGPEYP
jgi:hypothetical protein